MNQRDRDAVEIADETLSDGAVKRRTASGVFFVGMWGVFNLLIGLAGSIALARLLTPSDFGIVGVGATLMVFAISVADGGLGSGLIRRESAPTRAELRASLGLQLTLTLALAAMAAGVASLIGGAGSIVALMMLGLPLAALQTPGRVTLSRALRFRAISTSESAGMLAYYVWAVVSVVAGLGVWGLASAVVVRSVVTSAGIIWCSHLGVLLPTYRGSRALKPVIGFGLRFQAVSLAGMVREQGLNGGIAAIGGIATLGFWSLTRRLLEVPALMFDPLHRVSFPYLTHVLASRGDVGKLLDRGIAIAGTASGVVLATMAAAAPEAVPAIFGEQWRPAAEIFQWVCAALLVSGPLSVVAVGFLFAADAPSVVLRATILHTLALFIVVGALLGPVGPAAIGIGSLVGAVVDAAILSAAIKQRSSARPLRQLLPTVAIAAMAGAFGSLITAESGTGMLAAVCGAAAAFAAYVALMLVLRRTALIDTVTLFGQAVRSGLSRGATTGGEALAAPSAS